MPFKGDRRLGGPHDNEASLNGTSSDFVSVPAYGTVLSGPTDTSRYVNDYLGTPFYMPYSTTVYADGLGGQTSVETWGLQYYPAGWVTTTSQEDLPVSWGPYTLAGDGTTTLTGYANYGYNTLNHIEDGTGINYTAVASTTVTMADGYVIASNTMGTGADRYRITFNATTLTADIADYSTFPVYGEITGYYSSPVNYAALCQTFQIGTENGVQYANGYGGSFNSSSGITYNSAPEYLGHCGDQTNGWYFYHHVGNGNVNLGNAPAGFQLFYEYGESSLQWNAPDGTNGSFVYSTSESFQNADGNGGINYSGNYWTASDGQVITSGSYNSLSGNDEYGNPQYVTEYYSLTFVSAFNSYNTNQWQ